MAGIEHIVVHSKSYLVRWIEVPENHSLSWSLQPNKKSINFGIFKHPGTKNGLSPSLPAQETVESNASTPGTPALDGPARPVTQQHGRGSVSESSVVDKLQGIGLKSVAWTGRCEADKVAMGIYDIPAGEGGTYGLVFDNTFSRQTSKNVTFVLMTHPTNAPPKSGHHLHYAQGSSSGNSAVANVGSRIGYSPSTPAADSTESIPLHVHRAILEDPRPPSKGGHAVESKGIEGTTFYTGTLYKRKRKKGQGFAKRFFSLDFTSSTLSYYRNRHSSALRGAIPLSLAAVGANEKNREFSVDSGAEVWHLKAINKKDFEGWKNALERASGTSAPSPLTLTTASKNFLDPKPRNPAAEESEWGRVEQLVSKVSGTRDAVRALAKDTDPKYVSGGAANESSNVSPSSQDAPSQYFPDLDDRGSTTQPPKRSFWKRTASAERTPSALLRRGVSAQLAVPSPAALAAGPASPSAGLGHVARNLSEATQASLLEHEVHDRCLALLRDLNNVVADFSALIAESKARRAPPPLSAASRLSLESVDDQEFFDAVDSGSPSQLLNIRRSTDADDGRPDEQLDNVSEADSDASSDAEEVGRTRAPTFTSIRETSQTPLFPTKPHSLAPLPLSPVPRRSTVAPPKQSPPSFIGFLRKNAGKDLSTISMPVTANEPTSLLQRLAESLEYPQLLDAAAGASTAADRLLYVAAFAVSYYSNNRVKERAIRKPFNPMLGETYELVREDLGFRFVAEKVSHHPVRMACQADSLAHGGWSYTQSPQPVQKFWGKSVELHNEGRARVVLHASREHYSWSQATAFLRNVIAGEKYVEPVQTMTVRNETTGMRALATFKAGGMFSGRSEDVSVQLFDAGLDLPLAAGLVGKWTEGLVRTDTLESVWSVAGLVPDAARVYGFTAFAAQLNQLTAIEEDPSPPEHGLRLPPTDSRLRPDQLALESGDVDRAEALKARLEERQRARRKVLESHGQSWQPRFFAKIPAAAAAATASASASASASEPDEEVWALRDGRDGYWERRERGDWSGVQEVFEV